MAWDIDQVQILEKLWKAGLSASQIARQLGGGVTRNAVIGKVHRMGFADRGLPSRGGKSGGRRPMVERVAAPGRKSARSVSYGKSLAAPIPQLKPAEEDVCILDLADHKCRWPMGDPQDKENFRFCGGKLDADRVYCDYHTHVAYQRSNKALAAQEAEVSTPIKGSAKISSRS